MARGNKGNPRGNPNMKKGGPSINPSGRPKVDMDFRARCRALTDAVSFPKWEEEIRTHGKEWFRATELCAAYGHGRPPQPVTAEDAAAGGITVRVTTEQHRDDDVPDLTTAAAGQAVEDAPAPAPAAASNGVLDGLGD